MVEQMSKQPKLPAGSPCCTSPGMPLTSCSAWMVPPATQLPGEDRKGAGQREKLAYWPQPGEGDQTCVHQSSCSGWRGLREGR